MIRRTRMFVLSLAYCALSLSSGCSEQEPSVTGVAMADGTLEARGGNGVSVDATSPSSAPQGAAGLDVRVFGSGFEPGAAVTFLRGRKETSDITTNSTTFVNDQEVVANIDISAFAEPDLFDVRVEVPRGRKGIGIELFEVTGTPQECQLNFDLAFDDGQPVHSDGGGVYSDGLQHVEIFTSSGPGFRFDTNGSQQLDARKDKRWIRLDFSGTAWAHLVAPDDLKGTDLRLSNQGPGLNLCALQVGGSSTVAVDLPFEAADGDRMGLKYGGMTFSGNICSAPKVTVTRTTFTTWTMVSGATACIVQEGNVLDQSVAMPFALTVTAQGAVPY